MTPILLDARIEQLTRELQHAKELKAEADKKEREEINKIIFYAEVADEIKVFRQTDDFYISFKQKLTDDIFPVKLTKQLAIDLYCALDDVFGEEAEEIINPPAPIPNPNLNTTVFEHDAITELLLSYFPNYKFEKNSNYAIT